MFMQKRLSGTEAAAVFADMIDDYPAIERWTAPFSLSGGEPDGWDGCTPYWEIVDANEKPIAEFFCKKAAEVTVRALNARAFRGDVDNDSPVVVEIVSLSRK